MRQIIAQNWAKILEHTANGATNNEMQWLFGLTKFQIIGCLSQEQYKEYKDAKRTHLRNKIARICGAVVVLMLSIPMLATAQVGQWGAYRETAVTYENLTHEQMIDSAVALFETPEVDGIFVTYTQGGVIVGHAVVFITGFTAVGYLADHVKFGFVDIFEPNYFIKIKTYNIEKQ